MLLIHEAAVRTWLLADAAITALVGTRIYIEYAETGAALPYIVIALNAQQSPNTEAAESLNTLLNVQAVAVDNGSRAAVIANAVKARLDDAALTVGNGYTVRRVEFESAYRMTEIEDGKRFFYAGGLYRLEADKG